MLYNVCSSTDIGTLFQLRNLINRRNVVVTPKNDVAACEDFFLTVVEAHIISAAMELFEMAKMDDVPSFTHFPEGCSELDDLHRRSILVAACHALVEKFVNISYSSDYASSDNIDHISPDDYILDPESPDGIGSRTSSNSIVRDRIGSCPAPESIAIDHINMYASRLLSLGLLLMEFNDGIHEGDGYRIIRCWRYFLPIFKIGGRTNYSIEAFILLAQHDFLLTERMAAQLKWNRTVNTQGGAGKNISCDLHMEHLNREIKSSIAGQGSNVSDQSFVRAGKCLKKHVAIQQQFDVENRVSSQSGKHSRKSNKKDVDKIVQQLISAEVFKVVEGRQHKYFRSKLSDMFKALPKNELQTWMEGQLQKLLMFT